MKKCEVFLVMLLCVMLPLLCSATAASAYQTVSESVSQWQPVTVRDDLDRTITLDAQPQRIAVLMGSFADTWLLAGGELIAAPKDAWEDFELELGEDVVNLGSYQKISLETLFDLEADLIIASANTKNQVALRETLESAKVNILYFNVNSFEDYLRMLKTCTDITGRTDLYELNGIKILEQVEYVKGAAAAALEKQDAPRVLLVRTAASGIHVKGSEGTVLGLMLRDLGCVNIADGSELLDNLSIEKIIEEDPDMIFIVMQGSDQEGAQKTLEDALLNNPAWSGLTAVKEGRVHYMDKKLYHLKPNSRWGTAYEKLEQLLYGE